jgi:DNA modification methylase
VSFRILQGNSLDVLRSLPDESVHCCVTSPPYWGLRDYGVAGQLGLEKTPEEYVSAMVAVFAEVRRVLRADGTAWVNLGDSYAATGKSGGGSQGARWEMAGADHVGPRGGKWRPAPEGLKPKDLVGIPWMVAFALRADGWYLRSDIIWSKPNPMPESVTDRPTKAHEYIFLLSKSERYAYDSDAIRERFATDPKENYPARAHITGRGDQGAAAARGNDRGKSGGFPPKSHKGSSFDRGKTAVHQLERASDEPRQDSPLGRNKRTVWTVSTCPTPEAHFATYPPDLIEPCILAGCPEGGTVLDPFSGAGTTGLACLKHGRQYLGIELNPEYIGIAETRARKYYPLLMGATA